MKSTLKITSFISLIMIVFLSCSDRVEKKETYWENGKFKGNISIWNDAEKEERYDKPGRSEYSGKTAWICYRKKTF